MHLSNSLLLLDRLRCLRNIPRVRVDMASSERNQAEARSILNAWTWLLRCQNKGIDVSFASVVARVCEQCPNADVGRIQAEFARRHRQALQRGSWR
jgi:hypothetical protein